MQVLLIDSGDGGSLTWKSRLAAQVPKLVVVETPDQAMRALSNTLYAMIFFDWQEASQHWKGSITETIERLTAKSATLVSVTDRNDPTQEQDAYEAGCQGHIHYDFVDAEIASKLQFVQETHEIHTRLARARKFESVGELASGIAHEINTPIQYVGDNTRFFQSAYGDIDKILHSCLQLVNPETSPEQVDEICQSLREVTEEAEVDFLVEEVPSAILQSLEGVERVAKIVRAMKEFAHPGSAEMAPTDLAQSIENTVMVARNEWKYVADVDIEVDPQLPLVHCFHSEVNQVLLNMIVNAAHAIAEAQGEGPSKKGRITIQATKDDPWAEIRISDTGCGIASENIEQIFAPFFTTKAAGKGTGQGLSIAHSVIVEKHQGSIHVESELGKGTTFVIRIPLEQQITEEADQNATEMATS